MPAIVDQAKVLASTPARKFPFDLDEERLWGRFIVLLGHRFEKFPQELAEHERLHVARQ